MKFFRWGILLVTIFLIFDVGHCQEEETDGADDEEANADEADEEDDDESTTIASKVTTVKSSKRPLHSNSAKPGNLGGPNMKPDKNSNSGHDKPGKGKDKFEMGDKHSGGGKFPDKNKEGQKGQKEGLNGPPNKGDRDKNTNGKLTGKKEDNTENIKKPNNGRGPNKDGGRGVGPSQQNGKQNGPGKDKPTDGKRQNNRFTDEETKVGGNQRGGDGGPAKGKGKRNPENDE